MYSPVVNVGGVLAPTGGFPENVGESVCIGPGYVFYPKNADSRKPGHQHWMMPDSYSAAIHTVYYAQCVADTQGVIYPVRWGNLETAEGVYDFSAILTALNYCAANGKKMIIRFFWKTYTDANDPPLQGGSPAAKPVPDYIKTAFGTYGGVSGSGGMRRAYVGASFAGWAARLEQSAVNAKFRAFLAALVSATSGHSALQGYMFDESTWGSHDGSDMPGDLTETQVEDTMRNLYSYLVSIGGSKELYPNVNYLEGTSSLETMYQKAIDLKNWCKSIGMKVGVTDTYRIPDMATRFLQPVYRDLPDTSKTVVHVDFLSTGADDATLAFRMLGNARQSARLGANITAWYTRGGASSNYWAAAKFAMAAVG